MSFIGAGDMARHVVSGPARQGFGLDRWRCLRVEEVGMVMRGVGGHGFEWIHGTGFVA